jgi:hypothetical protein
MKMLTFLLWFYVYYFAIAGFVWLIAPHYEFSEITSNGATVIFGGMLSLMFTTYTVLDSE